MESLIVKGDLLQGAVTLARLGVTKPKERQRQQHNVVILSGFPCCVRETPPTETDGPPGALAIARAAVALGYAVTLVTDECNRGVFHAAALQTTAAAAQDSSSSFDGIQLMTFPSENQMTKSDEQRMNDLIQNKCDAIIACERAGPASDGNCYTMRGINMTECNLIAPLHRIVTEARELNNKKEEEEDTLVKFVAIGDGGNEMGMGKVHDVIVSNPQIKNAKKIAAVTAADYLITAGVSNWGGYALAAAMALVRANDEVLKSATDSGGEASLSMVRREWIEKCLPTEEDEVALLDRCVKAGCRDGVSGKMESTVDGMPLETSLECLRKIRDAAQGV